MSNIDIDQIIGQIKNQALLHKSIDIEEYKRNLKFLSNHEEINTVVQHGNIFKLGKKIDKKLYENLTYQKIRPRLVKFKHIVKKGYITIDLGDLLKYDDVQFIEILYRRLLNREPDETGLVNNLDMLRLNELTKIDIIKRFIESEEYTKINRNIRIKKFRSSYVLEKIQYKCAKIPYIGYLINIIIAIGMLPRKNREVEDFRRVNSILLNENKSNIVDAMKLLKKQEYIVNDMILKVEEVDSKYTEENEKIKAKFKQILYEFKKENDLQIDKIQKNIIESAARIEKMDISQKEESNDIIDLDEFYVKFEDKFRGSEELISKRLNIYIDKIKQNFNSEGNVKLLDLGCGRGEWINKLIANGFSNVIGVDLNSTMIEECKEKGLNVVYGNAIDYLKLQPDDSIDFISGFQIIEHLDFQEKMQLIKQSYRVLKKEGILLLETPNPENVLVGSCSFYIDLTHKNPVHPETLKFSMEEMGFGKTEIIRVNPLNYIDASQVTGEMRHIAFRFSMEQDYSVWGVK
ncbi:MULTISPECIES: methyltransferase domain-containing protein [unclassified Clostridium]|uniref:methyltransferase domain-containing protein n=1 Tax=unclassified Clostridium TaxID=2614128 RepID=UPI0002977411|nr:MULTISPECIES: methyltransferase domain-containing protein [unclassified Clostridium]EKQ50537.1 MAG: methylase involved in ubiquinone/menaquinone biosynthesis [Clostridium sp. Maddingley MBC34-26]